MNIWIQILKIFRKDELHQIEKPPTCQFIKQSVENQGRFEEKPHQQIQPKQIVQNNKRTYFNSLRISILIGCLVVFAAIGIFVYQFMLSRQPQLVHVQTFNMYDRSKLQVKIYNTQNYSLTSTSACDQVGRLCQTCVQAEITQYMIMVRRCINNNHSPKILFRTTEDHNDSESLKIIQQITLLLGSAFQVNYTYRIEKYEHFHNSKRRLYGERDDFLNNLVSQIISVDTVLLRVLSLEKIQDFQNNPNNQLNLNSQAKQILEKCLVRYIDAQYQFACKLQGQPIQENVNILIFQ